MAKSLPDIEESWQVALREEFEAEYFENLKQFLREEVRQHTVYPPGKLIFSAFNLTPLTAVRVVILGQDPYHGAGQAQGLAFSVPDGIRIPPSLQNIYKELHDDLGIPIPATGNLEKWARQGVMLLNATLTVRASQAGSHQGKGWERFTDEVIRTISDLRAGIVFLLWGRFAQEKETLIDTSKHFVLKAAHPSPFSAHKGFFGCRHFSKTNAILRANGMGEIDWNPVGPIQIPGSGEEKTTR
ncbi:uracil-DNA glycosylase [Candidatus Sulfidibacterium hydrothermale]|uniref:uracil-DNA glycosylase n=1 Tax=Candidatus Sulfidibacterium hydrothermale TaxID=2875962 RepID=UPI001F0A21EC|nr:uracil-DNA glycosylase [Candidatus Sulfidibacterium hydrothermale]UBM63244.1 uracil-DNA glycosylase [Candidatus Sulfidibacterium hydrothermale]